MRQHRIRNVRVERMSDDNPDTSWIGEYANGVTAEDEKEGKVIDRQERGDMERGQYRYFVATMSGKDTGNPNSVEEDYQRMESLNRGAWGFIGIKARCEVWIVEGSAERRIAEFSSPGLWGIESDSDQSYFDEVGQEELAQLKNDLLEFGLSRSQVYRAFQSVETVDA